ncbi:tripartite tricarboxylate transporter substrate-binding protein [Desulfobacula sp.]|uniref:Bug family tripartite tricarboxylate transporter substrate binding protein n=1 Tax=Desulfobacula sp. TaxID=2593537 RepID=UPI0026018A98|nr:tripartite tricarboxylate transporter substrate-binding protein [Desulfobacula sp.]
MADDYPSKDIRLIIGGKPGGGFDTYSRAISRYMEKYLPKGVHLIVENRPGAGHKIAISMVYSAKPDGYTIGMPIMPGLYFAQMFNKQNFDMTKVTWLVTILRESMALGIPPESSFKTIKDLQQADVVRVPAVGFASDIESILGLDQLGINGKYITGHKNSKDGILATLRGDGDAVSFTYDSMRKFFVKKQLIPVLIMGNEKRIPDFPDVPTLGELGYPEVNSIPARFRVIAGPPDMTAERTKYLREALYKTLTDPEFVDWSKKAKRPVEALTGEETEKVLKLVMGEFDNRRESLKKYMTME